jgi:hypothetical protein
MEVQEMILVEEQGHDLHPFNGWGFSVELKEIPARVDRIEGERAAKARQLSQLVMAISSALVDIGILPVQDIPSSRC